MNFASATEYLLDFTATGLQFVERFANKEGAGILANARPQMVKGALGPSKETVRLECSCRISCPIMTSVQAFVEAISTFPSVGSSFSSRVLHNRSSIKLRELPVSIRAEMLVPLILASTMAFFNSVAVGEEEEQINDVTEAEAVRLDALLHTFAK
ncbi:hypothetical protein T10_5476 [Trichinella papuae]|uniref:Uncharacterized protein n=1 Tax=Trichinella papuae TaxID=268474 RepID=A0A0V1ML34_9BILA|nr:hypothetical protein T10_5476 [Trichinella papuae]